MSSDGSIYGTTSVGGAGSHGTIFKMTPAGALTTLAEQYIARKGANPVAGLVQGSDGDFYGTTQVGGVDDLGTVFKVTSSGIQTTVAEFPAGGLTNSGQNPLSALVQGGDGNFYGTTQNGGTPGYGTVFKVTRAGMRTTLVNFTFNGTTNKGAYPDSELVQGSDGNFYGVTRGGGGAGYGNGTVFKMTPGGVLTTLVEFTDNGAANKGAYPGGALVQALDGNFYGTTVEGGSGRAGTIFKMTPDGVLTTLFEFPEGGQFGIGSAPSGALVQGADGNFYGTTGGGGPAAKGTIFKITPEGMLTTLVQFSGNGSTNTGSGPSFGVILGSDRNFYGTTSAGGTEGLGTIFMMTPDGTLTTLTNLTHGPNQGNAQAYRLVQGNDGNLYRTISGGHSGGSLIGAGSVYRLAPVGTPIPRTMTTAASTVAGGSTSGGGNRYNGSRVTLVAAPNAGYDFINWTEGGSPVSTSANYSFSATADRTLVANFALSSNADLASLQPSTGTLSPAFASGTANYKARVPFTTTSINLTPTAAHDSTSIQVNEENVLSGTASGAITLNPGANAITTNVTAPDGITKKLYVLTVTRESSPRDMNGDGKADLVFQNGAGRIVAWYMNGSGAVASSGYLYTGGLGDWTVKGLADMNGDGNTDLLFQNSIGQIVVWYLTNKGVAAGSAWISTAGLGDWKIVATADINGDGNTDLLFQNNYGQIGVWYMDGHGGVTSRARLSNVALGDWRLRCAADVNGDGIADLVFQNGAGLVSAWRLDASGRVASSGYIYNGALGDWKVTGAADINGDDIPDLLFQNNYGQIGVWYMDGHGGVTSRARLSNAALGDWRLR